MIPTTHRIALSWLALVLASGAAGCSEPPATTPPRDLSLSETRTRDSGSSVDRALLPDLGMPSICEKACFTDDISLCVRNPADDLCVECLTDAHCTENPGALGSRCDAVQNYCICTKDEDCASNRRGKRCDTVNQTCVCSGDTDCQAPYTLCLGLDVKTCRPPCSSDADCSSSFPKCDTLSGKCLACQNDGDCAKSTVNRFCSLELGRCVACRQDADCKPGAPYCDLTQGRCMECRTSSHCQTSPSGTVCDQGQCTCGASKDCQGEALWGEKCITQLSTKRCGCEVDAECKGLAKGPKCYADFFKCSCESDAQCTSAPYTKCAPPSDISSYMHCQPPCTSDQECRDRLFGGASAGFSKCAGGKCVACAADTDCTLDPAAKHCHTGLGRCVACLTDLDCGGSTPVCDTSVGKCVECRETADCAAHPNGLVCVKSACTCSSDTDCAGPYSWGKKCLAASGVKRCGCTADAGCAGVATGPTCYTPFSKCTCKLDAECSSGVYSKCALPSSGATYQTCRKPCATDTDCVFVSGLPKCVSGRCAACKVDTDCTGAKKYCSQSTGRCVGCKANADCAGEEWSRVCDPGFGCLECMTQADCTGKTLGNTCSNGFCVCSSDGDCAANLNGKVCNGSLRACSCLADSDCPSPKKCTGAFLSARICE